MFYSSGVTEESFANLLPMEMLCMGEDKFGGCEIGAREREGERGGCCLGGGLRLLCRKEGGQRPRKSGMESRTYGWAEGRWHGP